MRTLAILLTMAAAVTMGADKPRSFYVEVRGSGQPMILIPGLSSSPEVWKETVDRYKGRYECHLITVAGFMGKPRIEAPFLETVQRDLAAYIREKKLNKPVLLGHSLGGFVALRIAAAEPNLPGKVVIVDSVPYLALTMNPAIKPEAAKAMGDMMRTRVLNAPSGGNINWVKGMATKPEDHERIAAWGNQSDPRAVGDAMYEMFTTDLREEIGAITAPT
ncbi:MAG TPA: alpha/beta hydrolase, partial [Bryobacteraceae bacterium]|nr:alpha/beta hydrolase [Bryobacteraceae bacterium]